MCLVRFVVGRCRLDRVGGLKPGVTSFRVDGVPRGYSSVPSRVAVLVCGGVLLPEHGVTRGVDVCGVFAEAFLEGGADACSGGNLFLES